jgi:L-ascorbate metabolism protein UlaG (beta-lactamase superfamily)
MRLQLIRNATLRLDYGGLRILVDPYLAPKHSRPSYAGRFLNPLVDLPIPPEEVLAGIDLAIVSHLHSDHFDPAAQDLLPKGTPLVCRAGDEATIRALGFIAVTPLVGPLRWQGVDIAPAPGQHGSGAVLADMGAVTGLILQGVDEPTVYWAGDTILTPAVLETIAGIRPDVIVLHPCGAVWGEAHTLIVMDAAQAVEVCRSAPWATVVASHMEAVDHATVSRSDLRAAAHQAGIPDDRLRIPADGESIIIA